MFHQINFGGRKKRDVSEILLKIRSMPLNERGSTRSLAGRLGVSHAYVHKLLKSGLIRRHSNAIKPFLTDQHKLDRLKFALDHIDPFTGVFNDMEEIVHIDEKWFYMSPTKRTYYLVADEEDPHRSCCHKSDQTKVLFFAAVSRPCWDTRRNKLMNGRIGCWPTVHEEVAKRSSKNRPSGTIELKPHTIDGAVYEDMLVNMLLPALKEKWPAGKRIVLQDHNARAHTKASAEAVEKAAAELGLDLVVRRQPARSPDFNILDLGFFRIIQSLKDKMAPKSMPELIECVERAFNEQETEKLNRIFLTLQACMVESLKVKGHNSYKLPHLGKMKLEKKKMLPHTLTCDKAVIAATREYLGLPPLFEVNTNCPAVGTTIESI